MGRGIKRPPEPKGQAAVLDDRLRDEVAELPAAGRVAKLAERDRLDLADALARETELLGHFLERAGVPVLETEAQRQDTALSAVERVEHGLDLLAEHGLRRRVVRGDGTCVLDEVTEERVLFLADRRLEGHRFAA